MIYKSKNCNQTYELAAKLAKLLKGGDIVFLNGDLGAGKTTFVKGFAKALNIKENVTSPTFTLLKTYKSDSFTLVHVDAYRLDGELFEELDDYINDNNIIFIEWASCLSSQNPIQDNLNIDIKYVSKNQRKFIISSSSKKYDSLLQELNKND